MTSRPPTARPKTSAGSRAVSARLRRPPSSNRVNQFNVTERPSSRAAMVPEPVSGAPATVSRTVSRVGSIAPSRLNSTMHMEKSRSGITGTAQVVRMATGTIQLASRGNTARPITQQGLVGVRAPTRAGVGRSVVDKSYYMSILRTQMNNLMIEINKLRGDLSKGERDRQNLLIYEKKAEEEANIIRTLQGRLADCNKIMDLMNTNSDLNETDDELIKLREQRNDAEESLTELVNDRHMKEEAIRKLENEIEQQKAQNNAIFHSLDPTICDTYEELKKENENLLEEYRSKEEQLNELNRKKEQLEDKLAKLPLKQQAIELHERLAELETKKLAITNEINAEGTPDEQRERLLQMVVRTTDEINVIQKQLDEVKEQIEQAMEELQEFDTEMENAAGEKNEKYRELKLKEMEIDEFLNSYDNLRAEEESQIDKISAEVIRVLELISINSTYCQLISDNNEQNFNEGDEIPTSALNELYVCVQEELLAMEGIEKHLKMENDQINERIKEVTEMMAQFENIDNLKLHTEQKHRELENRREILNEELPKIKNSYQKLMNELEQTKSILEKNDDYNKLKNIQRQWQLAEQKLEELREVAAKREAETNYDLLKKEALQLQAAYNAVLIESMKPC